jgi:hypothetical protein
MVKGEMINFIVCSARNYFISRRTACGVPQVLRESVNCYSVTSTSNFNLHHSLFNFLSSYRRSVVSS